LWSRRTRFVRAFKSSSVT